MSENEIKPVDRVIQQLRNDGYDDAVELIERLEMIESSWLEFMNKTEWVQTESHVSELGKHRADVLKGRIDRLTEERDDYAKAVDFLELEMAKFQIASDEAKAERDAAVADAGRLRELLRVTASVAIVQLFDAAPADVEAEFSLDELQQIVEATSPLRDLGVSVESQYRIAIDAAMAEGK